MATGSEDHILDLLQDEGDIEDDQTSEEEDAQILEQESSGTESSCGAADSDYIGAVDDTLESELQQGRSRKRRRSSERDGSRSKPHRRQSRGSPPSVIFSRSKYKWKVAAPSTKSHQNEEARRFVPHVIKEVKDAKTPLETWSLLFPDTLIEKIVLHTNEEIRSKMETLRFQQLHSETNTTEIKALLGLFYACGLIKSSKCSPEELWAESSGMIQFAGTMSLHRFKILTTCLRFDDKNTRNERRDADRLAPIRDIWEQFIANCTKCYSPSQWCTIDEQLLGYRGRCPFRVFRKNKRDKYGMKVVMLNDVKTSYMLNAMPHTGIVGNPRTESIPDYYVRKLSEPIHGSGRNITVDNWFTSVPLVEQMISDHSLTMIGTIRKNQPEVPEAFKMSHQPFTAKFLFDHNKMLVSYAPRKNKIVLILSSLNQSPAIDSNTGKPEAVLDYNRTKTGTDTFDQLCHRYTVTRRTNRWALRFFYGMLDQCATNSCILYNLSDKTDPLRQRDFLRSLSLALLGPHLRIRLTNGSLKKSQRSCVAAMIDLHITPPYGKADKLIKQARCRYCNWTLDRKTTSVCYVCTVPICTDHRRLICTTCADD